MRTYFAGIICTDCKQVPERNSGDSRWQCACDGKIWPRVYGQRGTAEEHARLVDTGFLMTTDSLGDTYYIGQHGNIVWLFDDGTWRVHPDSRHESLDEFLERIKAVETV